MLATCGTSIHYRSHLRTPSWKGSLARDPRSLLIARSPVCINLLLPIIVALIAALNGKPQRRVLVRWNQAILRHTPYLVPAAPVASRDLAVANTCLYDVWAAYDEQATDTQLGGALRLPPAERTQANKEKAISSAAY